MRIRCQQGCPEPIPFFMNTSMIAALPFKAMGLGVNDMFVLVRYFSELGIDYITDKDESTILGELLAQAGPGTTVTSICNFAAFGCGVLLPIPAMADFCLGAAVIAIMNYVAMLTMFFAPGRVRARRTYVLVPPSLAKTARAARA